MVAPSGEGAVRCMRLAMQGLGNTPVDYINAHGTSTPVGDITELKAIREAFGADMPRVSSTKSLTGHRSEEHTSELQSLMRISSAVFCLNKKHTHNTRHNY